MNVKTVKLTRKYNLGNYEQAEIGLETELTELEGASAEGVQKAMKDLDKLFPHPVLTELFMDMPKQEPIPQPKQETKKPENKTSYEKEVALKFPADLEAMLKFTEKPDYVMIKPRQFLGSENFAKISSIVRGLGGEYISAGKDSHFRVKKK